MEPSPDSRRPDTPGPTPPLTERAYERLRHLVVISTVVVSMAPLILMTAINYLQFRRATHNEAKQTIRRLASNNQRSLEMFIEERLSALNYIINDKSFEELRSDAELARIISNMQKSMPVSALVDLGLIDAAGDQISYSGPFELHGMNYRDQDWFQEVARQGVHVSDIFLGFRKSPHFVLAIRHQDETGRAYILRATIDTQMLSRQILSFGLDPKSECFLVNPGGVLQTDSRRYGNVLARCPLALPAEPGDAEVFDWHDENGTPVILATAGIERTPFTLVRVKWPEEVTGHWITLRSELILFLLVSLILIMVVILWWSGKFVKRIREADERRATLLHKIEYTNKLASLGRLAAGTAHEINNPLAIINEKAGLLKDLLTFKRVAVTPVDRIIQLADSILKAVERCSTITHRLLGFAKHMEVRYETLDLRVLISELMGFLEKEIADRNLIVVIDIPAEVALVRSDRGQLQQVFLNLINNAIAAVEDGGSIEITARSVDPDTVSITVEDNGVGISPEDLGKLFEPFFTTKKGSGTGLGLSICYGIVQKLGGRIRVESEQGEWTRFTVTLPVTNKR